MADEEPSTISFQENLTSPTVMAALITGFSVIVVAFIGGYFLIATKSVETDRNSTGLKVSTNETKNGNSIPQNLANENTQKSESFGKLRTLTFEAPKVGSNEWEYGCCKQEIVFSSHEDKENWAVLTIKGEEHLVRLRVFLRDSSDKYDLVNLGIGGLKEFQNTYLETERFIATITPTEIEHSIDPDPEKHFPQVFKKVILRVKVDKKTKKK